MNATRNEHLQRMHARGNTAIVPTYREVYGGRNEVVAQVYLGHRAKFATKMRTPLIDNVSSIKIGPNANTDAVEALVSAARHAVKQHFPTL